MPEARHSQVGQGRRTGVWASARAAPAGRAAAGCESLSRHCLAETFPISATEGPREEPSSLAQPPPWYGKDECSRFLIQPTLFNQVLCYFDHFSSQSGKMKLSTGQRPPDRAVTQRGESSRAAGGWLVAVPALFQRCRSQPRAQHTCL